MMGILERARQVVSDWKGADEHAKVSATQYIREIAIRELTHQSRPHDAEELVEALEEASLTLDYYEALREAIPKVVDRERRRVAALELAAEARPYRARLRKARRVAEAIVRKAELEYGVREGATTTASNMASSLAALRLQFPQLFDESNEPIADVMAAVPVPEERPKPKTRECEYCGVEFTPKSGGEKFCGFRCSRDAEIDVAE